MKLVRATLAAAALAAALAACDATRATGPASHQPPASAHADQTMGSGL